MPQKQGRLPLYRDALRDAPRHWHPDGHPGLWWDKFCDLWVAEYSDLEQQVVQERGQGRSEIKRTGKAEWISTLLHERQRNGLVAADATTQARLELGDSGRLAAARQRLEALWQASGAAMVELELTAPFVTGTGYEHPTENGFLFHHSLGVPFLPGSALKGLARAWAHDWGHWPNKETRDKEIARIFGPPPASGALSVGSVVFFDALPTAPVKLTMEVMTPHYQPWYQADRPAARPPADWYDPTPIPFLALAPGSTFLFAVGPRRPQNPQDRKDAETAFAWLKDALDGLGAGAKTAIGFGRFEEAGARQQRDTALGQEAAKARASGSAAGRLPSAGEPASVAARVLGPARDFPKGTKVEVQGETGIVVGVEEDKLLVDFDGGPEPVEPNDVTEIEEQRFS